jgi:hypothetical protein
METAQVQFSSVSEQPLLGSVSLNSKSGGDNSL